MKHDWVAMVGMFVLTLAINALIFAYGYGKLDQRVQQLEKQAIELRADWKEARERIEKAIKEKQ